ncbi:DMT family transporter [Trinickia sp. NRRL B-1857]|uniref:DMT family transporter n=1 Tax=Trinickia sp. NRRL B-1857 TaxID=3162879 RepID=UPI003D2D51B6
MSSEASYSSKATGTRYVGLIIVSTFLQGSSFVASQIVLRDMAPLWLASVRFLVASVAMIPLFWLVKRQRFPSMPKGVQWLHVVVIGALQTAGVMALLNFGLRETTAARAALLMASNPLVVAVLSTVVLGEALSRRAAFGLLIAFAGVLASIGGDALTKSGGVGRGELLVACASLCWASSTTVAKRIGATLGAFELTFWQMLTGSFLLIAIAYVSGQTFRLPQSQVVWDALLWLSIPASMGAMGTWFGALALGGAVRTSGFLFLCPVFSAAIAFLVNGETVSGHEIAGAGLVGVGLLLLAGRRATMNA